MAPRLRPLLTPPNDGTQKENKLDLRVALKTGAGQKNSDFHLILSGNFICNFQLWLEHWKVRGKEFLVGNLGSRNYLENT